MKTVFLMLYSNPATDEIIVERGISAEGAQVPVLSTLGAIVVEGRLASGTVRLLCANGRMEHTQ